MFKKYKEKNDNQEMRSVVRMFLPSVLGMVLCVSCLVGGTFAWFTASQSVSVGNIKAAKYGLKVTITEAQQSDNSTSETSVSQADNIPVNLEADCEYSLNAGKTYTVRLEATGTAKTGYCLVELKNTGKTYVKEIKPIDDENTFTFNVSGVKDTMCITAHWGTVRQDSDYLDLTENVLKRAVIYVEGNGTLQNAIKNASSSTLIILNKDINENITVVEGKNVEIDLNGHTITNSPDTTGNDVKDTFTISGDVTITDNSKEPKGTVVATGSDENSAFKLSEGAKLNLNNITVESNGNGITGKCDKLAINNCEINVMRAVNPVLTEETSSDGTITESVEVNEIYGINVNVNTKGSADITDTEIIASGENVVAINCVGGLITIESGTYTVIDDATLFGDSDGNIQIKGGSFGADPSDYLADGFEAPGSTNGMWTVVKETE